MKIEEFARRVNILSNPTSFTKLFRSELNEIFSSILFYMANEQITNTAQARFTYADAIAKLGSHLYGDIEVEVYNMWKNLSEGRELHKGNFNMTVNGLSYMFSTSDSGAILQNSNKANISSRERKYKGILGSGYTEFYLDKILRIVTATMKGSDTDSMPLLISSINNLNKKVKAYMVGGK